MYNACFMRQGTEVVKNLQNYAFMPCMMYDTFSKISNSRTAMAIDHKLVFLIYRQLRARRALSILKNVPR